MIDMITAALGGVKQAKDLTEAVIEANQALAADRVKAELLPALAQAYTQLLEAKLAQSDLADALREAKAQVAKMKDWKREAKNYVLEPAGLDAYCYMLKAQAEREKSPHRLCQSCYEEHHKRILQFNRFEPGSRVLVCPRCKTEVRIPRTDGGDLVMTAGRSGLDFRGY